MKYQVPKPKLQGSNPLGPGAWNLKKGVTENLEKSREVIKQKIMKTIFYLILITVFFSSCAAYHSGYMVGSGSLTQGNFSYVAHDINGSYSAVYVFGIGGLTKSTLVHNAKLIMLHDFPLKNNQALVNLTVNYKTAWYALGIVAISTCTITADVVEFSGALSSVNSSPYPNYNFTDQSKVNLYQNNDKALTEPIKTNVNQNKENNDNINRSDDLDKLSETELYELKKKAIEKSDYNKVELILFEIVRRKYGDVSTDELEIKKKNAMQNHDQNTLNELNYELRRRKNNK